MAIIKAHDLNIGYKERGEGTPVVFLHGVGSDKELWDEQLNYFSAAGWRAVSVDYPGYGESDLPIRSLGRAEIADYVAEALTRINVERAHIVGLSMGGVIALEMTLRRQPTRTPRALTLTLANTFAAHPDAAALVERAHQATEQMTMREFAEGRVRLALKPGAAEENVRLFVENMSRVDRAVYRWASVAVWTGDYSGELSRVDVPTLVVVGEHDRLTPVALSEHLAARVRDAQLFVVPDAGHISNLDNPSEFNRAVEKHITANRAQ